MPQPRQLYLGVVDLNDLVDEGHPVRALERMQSYEPGLRWLCAGERVNHPTLSDFRVRYEEALDGLSSQVVAGLKRETGDSGGEERRRAAAALGARERVERLRWKNGARKVRDEAAAEVCAACPHRRDCCGRAEGRGRWVERAGESEAMRACLEDKTSRRAAVLPPAEPARKVSAAANRGRAWSAVLSRPGLAESQTGRHAAGAGL